MKQNYIAGQWVAGVDVRRIPAGLGAQQRGKQRRRAALQGARERRRVVDLVELARTDGLLNARHGGIERGTVVAALPQHLMRHLIRRLCAVGGLVLWPGPGRVVHGEPGQGAIGGVGRQGSIERRSRLVAHVAHTPAPRRRRRMHGVEHAAHLGQRVGRQHRARRSKGMAQAWRTCVQQLGEVDARRIHGLIGNRPPVLV